MRKGTYRASDAESVEEGGGSGIGKKRTGEKGDGAANAKRTKAAAALVNPKDEGGICGVGADGGADATARKNPRGGAYSKAKSGDLWMHTIN